MARLPGLMSHSSFRWTMAYIIVATLWISLVQWLLSSLGGARWVISPAGLVVGGVFVLVTAWLLFLLLERNQAVPLTEQALRHARFTNPRLWWGALTILIAFTLLAQLFMVSYATREYRPVLINQAQTELTSQLRLHSKLISDWLTERTQIVDKLAAQSSALAERIRFSQAQPIQQSGSPFPSFVALIQDGRFRTIALFDPDHVKKLQFGSNTTAKTPDDLFERAAATSKVQFACVFEPGKDGGNCYWVLPVYLSKSEVSGGPWYIVLDANLNESGLVQAMPAGESLRVEHSVRTLLLLVQGNDAEKSWQAAPLITDFSRLSGPKARSIIHPVDELDLECFRKSSAFLSLQAQLSPYPPDASVLKRSASGQVDCQGSTLLYASAQIPKINGLLWAATTQSVVLDPLRQTRQWLAAASLIGVLALLIALFLFWRIMRLQRAKVLAGLRRERDQLAQLWDFMPAMGLAIVNLTDWRISLVNQRWMQIFHDSQESLQGRSLLEILSPVTGLNTVENLTAGDQKLMEDVYSGLRDEVSLLRRVRTGESSLTWVRFHIRALKSTRHGAEGLIVAADGLGDSVELANELKAERDFCRLTAAFCQPPAKQSTVMPMPGSVPDVAPEPEAETSTEVSRLTPLAKQVIEQTSLLAMCLYTHWPEVWSCSSELAGPQMEQQEHKSYECVGCTTPVREIANQVAHMGLIDRVLVAQTPMFIDDDARNTATSGTLQNELIEQLKQYPVGALAIVPIPATSEGDPVRALIVFGEDNLRFTEPVRTSLLSLLKTLTIRLDEKET
jgi:PAS domain-containing protein